MLEVMKTVLDDDVHSHHGPFLNQVQQCFAVRAGQDGLLDLGRETFQRLSEEIYGLLPAYKEMFGMQSLQVSRLLIRTSK
jgi:DNA mismatch repair protein MSH4